jgi:protoporphyrinogen IX oxidase
MHSFVQMVYPSHSTSVSRLRALDYRPLGPIFRRSLQTHAAIGPVLIIALLKFIHITTIALWAAGLISLPGLYVQRAHVKDRDALYRLQMMVRYAYVTIISPAAFIAVLSGTALIFGRETYAGWFAVKLLFVGFLAITHILTGLVIIRLFREGEIYPVWRFVFATVVTSITLVVIIFVALAKPLIEFDLPDELVRPGGLKSLVERFSPWPIP